MGAKEAVEFLIKYQGEIEQNGSPKDGAYKDFVDDKPLKSLLQATGKTLDEVLELFDWKDDDAKWTKEYNGDKAMLRLIRYRRCVAFCIGAWRELNEDFGRGDVSCLRDIRTPFVTSRTPLKASKDDFSE